ncbi:hypothetical protein BU26DRAFT_511306 [Trematosphaeria pertusa]|uniref:Uncharacterized protein n=1 Tax=Trematosphaeria pertusa TaxID=390896 RepID=A0A6A6HUS2_9PLEO|nr:uncharacterized protein BU26DRAFT_511306 [Trematosphaeria pertusa]KAF2241512.1 hypothetical protein BU26DRAFT_511306 [Trematosphaeria pertusa]
MSEQMPLQSCITHRVALTGQLVRPGVKQWQQGRQRGQFEPERECPGCAQSILSDYVAGFIPSPVRKHALLESSRSIHQLPGSVVSAMIIDLRRDPHHFYSHVRAAYQRISTADPRQTIPQKEYRGPNLSMQRSSTTTTALCVAGKLYLSDDRDFRHPLRASVEWHTFVDGAEVSRRGGKTISAIFLITVETKPGFEAALVCHQK